MVERRAGEGEGPPSGESILAKEFISSILSHAKENLERDRALAPILFLRFQNGDHGIVPLELPKTTEEKEAYFKALGGAFRQAGRSIWEAVFVSETWFVAAEKGATLSFDVAPSRHPRRKEAITLVGGNAERTRFSMVVQPFSRDRRNRPVLERIAIEEYNVSATEGYKPVGLLDHLFPGRLGLFRDDPRLVE
jgi:hypothetical protein